MADVARCYTEADMRLVPIALAIMAASCTGRGLARTPVIGDPLLPAANHTDPVAGTDLGAVKGVVPAADMAPVADIGADMSRVQDMSEPAADMVAACLMLGDACSVSSAACCQGQGGCGFTGVGPPVNPGGAYDNCCVGEGMPCNGRLGDCCYPYICRIYMTSFLCVP